MSLTYQGVIVGILGLLLRQSGIEIGTADLTTTVTVIMQLVGAIIALYGRYRLGGVSVLGVRK